MASLADKEKLEMCANFLLNERGYLVIGTAGGCYSIGQIIFELWNSTTEQPLRVIAETTREDWMEQSKVASRQFDDNFKRGFYVRKDPDRDETLLDSFYRVVTD